jgi:large subunit ribosomal protein L13
MKTIFVNPKSIDHKWYLIDAEGKVLGRLAVKVTNLLRGKHRPYYTPHQEVGDSVIVINADKIRVTGQKETKKIYYHHTGYLGGMKSFTLGKMLERKPVYPIEEAVRGMLPHNALGRKLFKNLKVYAGAQHPHSAQKPEKIDF